MKNFILIGSLIMSVFAVSSVAKAVTFSCVAETIADEPQDVFRFDVKVEFDVFPTEPSRFSVKIKGKTKSGSAKDCQMTSDDPDNDFGDCQSLKPMSELPADRAFFVNGNKGNPSIAIGKTDLGEWTGIVSSNKYGDGYIKHCEFRK